MFGRHAHEGSTGLTKIKFSKSVESAVTPTKTSSNALKFLPVYIPVNKPVYILPIIIR